MGNKKNTQVLYHVLHSVLKKGISDKFKYSWLKKNKALKENIKISNSNTLKDLKLYFPNMDVKRINKNYISARVLLLTPKKQQKEFLTLKKVQKIILKFFQEKLITVWTLRINFLKKFINLRF